MNINMEKRFLEAPTVDMPRSNVDLSYEHQTTFNVGELIPIGCQEVYPGDTHKITTSKVIRLQTLLNPIYGTLYADIRHFFVPMRLVDEHFEELMGANKTSAWAPTVEYTTPQMAMPENETPSHKGTRGSIPPNSLPDYFGIPVGYQGLFNANPIRCYHKIWDDWYRDENVQDPLNLYTGQALTELSDDDSDYLSTKWLYPRKAGRMHDVFSSCLPAPQKSEDPVMIPFSGTLPVATLKNTHDLGIYYSLHGKVYDSSDNEFNSIIRANEAPTGNNQSKTAQIRTMSSSYSDEALGFHPDNLWAVADPNYSSTYNITSSINDLRTAFQIQRLLERDAYGGSRYVEILKAHFGVTSPDARLQRSEYLGGNRIPLNVHQVINNSSQGEIPLGELGAISHTVDIHEDFVKSFTEHGYIITVCCVRYQNVYAQGLERFWSRSDRYSYFWPVMSHLGNMAVENREIYALGSEDDNNGVFGYQEAWYDLRTRQNRCSSEMRPGITNSLATWNLADYYTETPVLSDAWMRFEPDIVDRVLAVGHSTANQIFADFYFQNDATRVIPLYSIPGMIDHF